MRLPSSVGSDQGVVQTWVRVASPGYGIDDVRLRETRDGEGVRGAIDLHASVDLTAQVIGWEAACGFPILERRTTFGAWLRHPRGPDPGARGMANRRYSRLAEGTYRLRCPVLDISSRAMDVHAGGRAKRLIWDLSARGWASGEVVLPEGVTAEGLEILVDGERRRGAWAPKRLTGRFFRVMVPGDHAVRISATHPACRPSAAGGEVVVTAPRGGLTLLMEKP